MNHKKAVQIITRIYADLRELQAELSVQDYELKAEPVEPTRSAPRSPAPHVFLREFSDLYQRTLKAAPPTVTGKHASLVRGLLKVYPRERLIKMAEVLLLTDDEWVSSTDRWVSILHARAAWLDLKLKSHGL